MNSFVRFFFKHIDLFFTIPPTAIIEIMHIALCVRLQYHGDGHIVIPHLTI